MPRHLLKSFDLLRLHFLMWQSFFEAAIPVRPSVNLRKEILRS